jgi:hypothetical protein
MDTGVHAAPTIGRGDAVLGKVDLLKMAAASTARQGVKTPEWRTEPAAARSIARPDERKG